MTNPQGIIIYNPLAGPSDFGSSMEMIAAPWRDRGWKMTVRPTEAAGHATTLAAEAAASGHDLVLAVGGDGTLGEVANGLAGTSTVLGLLPAGTANSFARELHMPLPGAVLKDRLVASSGALLSGRVQSTDLGFAYPHEGGKEKGHHWILWAGTGADGHLVNILEPRPKWAKKIGRASYVMRGIPALATFSHVWAHVEVDRHVVEGEFVLVLISNCRRYAGGLITLSDEVYLDDGSLEIWLFGGRGFGTISRHALQALRGQHHQDPDVLLLRGHEIVIQTEPEMPVQMDGDPIGQTPFNCLVKPGALRLLVPDTAPPDLFLKPGEPIASHRV